MIESLGSECARHGSQTQAYREVFTATRGVNTQSCRRLDTND